MTTERRKLQKEGDNREKATQGSREASLSLGDRRMPLSSWQEYEITILCQAFLGKKKLFSIKVPPSCCQLSTQSWNPRNPESRFLSFVYGCAGSLLLHAGFLQLWGAGATLGCSVQSSHCGAFSCCGAQALGAWASVVVTPGLVARDLADDCVCQSWWCMFTWLHGLSCICLCNGRGWLQPHMQVWGKEQAAKGIQLCPTLCNSMDCHTPGFPVPQQLPEFAQIYVHRVVDAIQPSNPVIPISSCFKSFPASGSFPMSQFLASGRQSIGALASASVLLMNIQE